MSFKLLHKLLRKATKEDIVVGNKLIDSDDGNEFEIVVGTTPRANLSSEFVMWNEDFGFRVDTPNTIRLCYLAPLAWVMSKPVYKGDTLWTKDGDEVTVLESDGNTFKTTPSKCGCTTFTKDFLRWEKPTKEFQCLLVLKKDGTSYTASTGYMVNTPDIAEIRNITWEVEE